MAVEVREVKTGRDLKRYIFFPEKLYEERYPQWVHPIYASEKEFFDRRKNPAWRFSDGILFMARRDGETAGRITGIINHKYNKFNDERLARFAFFDCIDDQAVASALLGSVEEWARSRGCEELIGPIGFTDLDPEGMLVEGFKERAAIASWWHPPYTPSLLERAGYEKKIDWVTYIADFITWPKAYEKIAERVLSRTDYRLVEFTNRKQLKRYIIPVFRLINETYVDLYGFSPFEEEEMLKITNDYLPLLEPRLVKIVILGQEVVAFTLGVPDMTEGIRAARGRLFPLGLLKISKAARKSERLDMLLGAVKKGHRGKGIDVLMANAIRRSALKRGITKVDSHHELEDNLKVRGEMERIGGKVYKRHRLFTKRL